VSKISRVIIAGCSLNQSVVNFEDDAVTTAEQAKALEPLNQLDGFLTQLASSIPVDIMPGCSDPTTASLPQKPLNRAIIPESSRYSTLKRVYNPYSCNVDGVR
jgi:DNA polymerase delta subunit 2